MPTQKTQSSTSKSGTNKGTGKRELIEPKGDKRYVRRNDKGEFSESDDQSRSLSQDVKKHAKTEVKPGHGDEGDRPRKSASGAKKTK
jgi:hypothetical protein